MRGRDDTAAIRISNLSESITESDLEELVKKIGQHSKMYLARDKVNNLFFILQSELFREVSYFRIPDCAKVSHTFTSNNVRMLLQRLRFLMVTGMII